MVKIHRVIGNTQGIRDSILKILDDLYEYQIPKDEIFTDELCKTLVNVSLQINREVAIYANRRGYVTHVMVGDQCTVPLAGDLPLSRRGLSGFRCIHTHPSGCAQLSEVDISALSLLNLDAMIVLAKENDDILFSWAHLLFNEVSGQQYQEFAPMNILIADHRLYTSTIKQIEQAYTAQTDSNEESQERVLLVGAIGMDYSDSELAELQLLSEAAGVLVVGKVTQKKDRPDKTFYVGYGKAREIALISQCLNVNVIITDDELSPAQIRNLEELWGRKVIDRTSLILDIFAQRARTMEGKLQVELAQMKYMLPRLTGQGLILSRQGGGIGTRGPGETKLEVDRRRIRNRITELEGELERVKKHRSLQRKQRKKNALPLVSLVGYTNAGKTTLMAKLMRETRTEVPNEQVIEGENKLFATLDPTTRRIKLPNGRDILLTDTVGFIRKLPHHLVNAFRATLEEILEADLILHVVDASHPQVDNQILTVELVLKDLGATDRPMLMVLNKSDLLADSLVIPNLGSEAQYLLFSAVTGEGYQQLMDILANLLSPQLQRLRLKIPFSEGAVLNYVHQNCEIEHQSYEYDGVILDIATQSEYAANLEKYKL